MNNASDPFLDALQEAFGPRTFTVHDVMDLVPQATWPHQVRMALMGQLVLNTSPSRSLGLYLRHLDGVESTGRGSDGRIWKLNADAKGLKLGRPAGTVVGRFGSCQHCGKPSRNLGQHEKRCGSRTGPRTGDVYAEREWHYEVFRAAKDGTWADVFIRHQLAWRSHMPTERKVMPFPDSFVLVAQGVKR